MGINVSIHKSVRRSVPPSAAQLHAAPASGQTLESSILIASQIRVPAARFPTCHLPKFIHILLARLGSAAPTWPG